ncbi:MAG TPA: hypothetical protein VIY52_05965 [Streptosporangiaceae bacterium]
MLEAGSEDDPVVNALTCMPLDLDQASCGAVIFRPGPLRMSSLSLITCRPRGEIFA